MKQSGKQKLICKHTKRRTHKAYQHTANNTQQRYTCTQESCVHTEKKETLVTSSRVWAKNISTAHWPVSTCFFVLFFFVFFFPLFFTQAHSVDLEIKTIELNFLLKVQSCTVKAGPMPPVVNTIQNVAIKMGKIEGTQPQYPFTINKVNAEDAAFSR